MGAWGARRKREEKTLSAMVWLFCRVHHDGQGLCPSCQKLLAYAHQRLDRCPFGDGKPTCVHCPIHCYKPEPREAVRQVMGFSGPRMLLVHPILALRHLWDEWRDVRRLHQGKPVVPARDPGPGASRSAAAVGTLCGETLGPAGKASEP
ncbi:MAG: nitrous oxide-stimulated promoter family protein [Thermoanaerobaculum sp.]